VLGYKTDLPYEIFKGIKKPWDWGSAGEGHPDTSEALRKAMAKNPHMKVLVCSGYYDLATPFFATEYTLAHMGLDPELHGNVSVAEYEAGHMMYVHEPSLKKFKSDCAGFIKRTKNV
jgi:carboxypeptidase C (cathepsin A)